MDEVIADFFAKHLMLYNISFEDAVNEEDLHGTRLWKIRPNHSKVILDYVDEPEFFSDLAVMEGSQEVIRELSEHYEVFITTAAMEHPNSFTAKYQWLKEHFPFLSDLNFVFCGDKSIIQADYLIDDSPRHFENFSGQGLLYTAAHNRNETGYVRVNNWNEIRDYFLSE